MRRIGIDYRDYMADFHDEKGLALMKEHGYTAVNFCMMDTNAPLYTCSIEEMEKTLTEFRKFLNDNGVEVFQTHGPWSWPVRHATKEEQAQLLSDCRRSIYATRLLGAKYFVLHPLMPFGSGYDPDDGPGFDAYKKACRDFYTKIIPIAQENDVVVCVENMPMTKLSISIPERILEFVKEMDSPYLKVCLDTGHCTMHGVSPADAVRQLGKDYLMTLHVHDNNGTNDSHWIPYTGVIDWDDFAKALDDIDYDGVVMLETGINMPYDIKEDFQRGLAKATKKIAGIL